MAADWFGAASSLLGGLGGLFSSNAEAKGFEQSAAYYQKAARYAGLEAKIKDRMTRREVYRAVGGAQADIAASGLKLAGSAIDVVKDSAREGALSLSLVRLQGQIEQSSYMAQAAQAQSSASSKKSGGIGSMLGSVIGIAGALFSDDDLKEDISLLRRRSDGLGIYTFRYRGSPTIYEGVMASEVEVFYPEAVFEDDGYRKVNYDAIGVEFKTLVHPE